MVLGNPPYNGYAGMATAEERGLTDAYRTTKKAPAPQGQGLNDLYVRFFRMAERRIVEKTGKGIVCFISNYSWLDGLSFTGMRERYLEVFDKIWIDCLNGDKYKTGKLTPDGKPDPSVFSTEQNRRGDPGWDGDRAAGAERGHAVGQRGQLFREFWGAGEATRALAASLAERDDHDVAAAKSCDCELGLPFRPGESPTTTRRGQLLTELFPVSSPGVHDQPRRARGGHRS